MNKFANLINKLLKFDNLDIMAECPHNNTISPTEDQKK
jgi:hypothetical protein